MSNASVIDNQLERIVNCFFGFLLIMLVLFIMKVNPWPFLVSMTSLLVSVSFALGQSVSNYLEVSTVLHTIAVVVFPSDGLGTLYPIGYSFDCCETTL